MYYDVTLNTLKPKTKKIKIRVFRLVTSSLAQSTSHHEEIPRKAWGQLGYLKKQEGFLQYIEICRAVGLPAYPMS